MICPFFDWDAVCFHRFTNTPTWPSTLFTALWHSKTRLCCVFFYCLLSSFVFVSDNKPSTCPHIDTWCQPHLLYSSPIKFCELHSAWPIFILSSIYASLFPHCSGFVVAKSACAKKRKVDDWWCQQWKEKNMTVHVFSDVQYNVLCACSIHRNKCCIGSLMCLSPQGNVAFESPRGARHGSAVCWMGIPRSAAGKEAMPSVLHPLQPGTLLEICQKQSGITEEPQWWFMVFDSGIDERELCVDCNDRVKGLQMNLVSFDLRQCHTESFLLSQLCENTWACGSHSGRWHLSGTTRGLDSLGLLGGGANTCHRLKCVYVCVENAPVDRRHFV